jgi:hypothetical protein
MGLPVEEIGGRIQRTAVPDTRQKGVLNTNVQGRTFYGCGHDEMVAAVELKDACDKWCSHRARKDVTPTLCDYKEMQLCHR